MTEPIKHDFTSVPGGTYACRVAEVRTGQTSAGDERWSLRLLVDDGPLKDRLAAWDSLVFGVRGRARARTVLKAFGLPKNGKVQIEPKDLEGARALVEVRPAEYLSPHGDKIVRNEVPYDGYRECP